MAPWMYGGGLMRRSALAAAAPRGWSAAGYHTIEAVPREVSGRYSAMIDRKNGRIPSVVFDRGSDGSAAARRKMLTTNAEQLSSLMKKEPFFLSTTFRLEVRPGPGSSVLLESGTVLPVKVYKAKKSGKILNLEMVWAEEGLELKVDVPIIFKGAKSCSALKKGGYLMKMRTDLRLLCPSEHIPKKIEVDVRKLNVGEQIFVRDVTLHPSLKLLISESAPICKILASKPAAMEDRKATPEAAKPETTPEAAKPETTENT